LDDCAIPWPRRNRIVLELTELREPESIASLAEQFDRLRQAGFQLAIDDVGAGTSGLNRIMRLRPNCLKMDRELIAGVDTDPFRQNLVRFFVHFASLSNMRLITEGVEREEELRTLIDLNVGFAQGFLLGRPAQFGATVDPIWQERIPLMRHRAETREQTDPRLIRIKDLALPLVNCPVGASREEFESLIGHLQDVPGIAIMDGRQVLAYVPLETARRWMREASAFSTQSLIQYSERGWIIASPEATVSEAIMLATNRTESELSAPILVVSDDVVGLVPMRSLLQTAANLQPASAPHTSALTGLPGRVQIDQQVRDRIETVDRAVMACIDIRCLSDYNEVYGFDMGDSLIRHLAGLLVGRFLPPSAEFIAHDSDDRFVVISESPDFHAELLALAREFDLSREAFVDPKDIEQAILGAAKFAEHSKHRPLTSIRIILLPDVFRCAASPRQASRKVQALRAADQGGASKSESDVTVFSFDEMESVESFRRSA